MNYCGTLLVVLASAAAGCTLTQGGPSDAGLPDSQHPDVGPDAPPPVDAGPDAAPCTCPGPGFHCNSTGACDGYFATCDEMHKGRKELPSDLYQFSGPKGLYFAYCDMAKDNGGWTLVGRSVASAQLPALGFGWLAPAGDPSIDAFPYAFDFANYTGSPKEALVGLYTTNKNWDVPAYKIALPANFPAAFKTTSATVAGSAIAAPTCGAALATSLKFMGFTSHTLSFYFDPTGAENGDAGSSLGGLGFAGFNLPGNPDAGPSCQENGEMNAKQGQIFVR